MSKYAMLYSKSKIIRHEYVRNSDAVGLYLLGYLHVLCYDVKFTAFAAIVHINCTK